MPSPLQARRAEQKLGLIFDRVGAIRSRLNSLALQGAVFGFLGWAIGCVAVVFLGAYYTSPLVFLAITVLLAAVMLFGFVRTGRASFRMHSTMLRAAEIADERAGLKGRLETIIEVGRSKKVPARGEPAPSAPTVPMWSYLIEDALAHQSEFEPARIEKRILSRSIYGLLGALLLALLALPLIRSARHKALKAAHGQSDITLGLNDLRLRPADPDSKNGVEVHADARTMRMLEQMMAAQGTQSSQSSSSPLNRLLDRARGFADHLQNKLTGRESPRPRINLKLADADKNLNGLEKSRPPFEAPPSEERNPREHANSVPSNSSQLPPMQRSEKPPANSQASAADGKSKGPASLQGPAEGKEESSSATTPHHGHSDQGGGTGSSHGSGTDADSLFGQRTEPNLSGRGFQIAIEARPMANGPKSQGHPYLPPKVSTPINSEQHPDEPIPRVAVPEPDQAAVKSVFER